MFRLVRKSTLEAQERLRATMAEALEVSGKECRQQWKEGLRLRETIDALNQQVLDAAEAVAGAEKERDQAVEAYKELEWLHSTRVRVGAIHVDPEMLTARLRAIEPTLRAEFDGHKVVVYARRHLEDAERRAVMALLKPDLDRT